MQTDRCKPITKWTDSIIIRATIKKKTLPSSSSMGSASSSEDVQSPFVEGPWLEEATSFKAARIASACADSSMHSSKARLGDNEPTKNV